MAKRTICLSRSISLSTLALLSTAAIGVRGDVAAAGALHQEPEVASAAKNGSAAAPESTKDEVLTGSITGKDGELRAAHILKQSAAVYSRMKTITADYMVRQEVNGMTPLEMYGSLRAAKPNLYSIDGSGSLPMQMTSDGKTVLFYIKQQNAYAQLPADDRSMNLTVTSVAPLTLFFNSHKLTAPNTPTFYLGTARVNGAKYDCVEQRIGLTTMRYYIGSDRFVYRIKVHVEMAGRKQDVDATMSHVQQNAQVDVSAFNTTAPTGAQRFEMPMPGVQALTVGDQAPQFTLPQPDGRPVSLSETLQEKKAVLVTFWFCACATCREEHPRLQKLYSTLKDRGLGVLAIDSFDDRPTVKSYLRHSGISFPACLDDDGNQHHGIANQYGVSVYPTTFLVNPNGKIVFRGVGFDEAAIRAALNKLQIR